MSGIPYRSQISMLVPPTEDEHLIRLKDLTAGGRYALTSVQVVITAQNVAEGHFDLPAGAPDMDPAYLDKLVLTLNTSVQYAGTDYEGVADASGKYRRVSWVGLGLSNNPPIQPGDRVWVLYPVQVASSVGGGGGSGSGLPPGGDAGQVLTKSGGADGDADWQDPQQGGHLVLDGFGGVMPQRSKLQFVGCDLTDDSAEDTTRVTVDFMRPLKPRGTSPEEGAVDVPILTRLTLSAYTHPLALPMGGSKWQVATDPDFTALVFDVTQFSSADSVVLSTDENSNPWLSPSTTYYWRGAYLDLKDNASQWSDPLSFTTAASAALEAILKPSILYPANEGFMPESKLISTLSAPVAIGALVPDKMDLQVSMTPDFAPASLLLDYADYPHTTLLMDDSADFTAAPSPLYMRARQKDSVRAVESPWSGVPTVWLQRVYSGLVIGLEVLVPNSGNGGSFSRWIDESGEPVTCPPDYFSNHPLWAGIQHHTWTDAQPTPMTHDMVRIPPFYGKGDTVDDGTFFHHRIWLSPVPRDGFRLMPLFRRSPGGISLSACLLGLDSTTSQYVSQKDLPAGNMKRDDWGAVYQALNGAGVTKVIAYNIHARVALCLLIALERGSISLGGLPGGGVGNGDASCRYRGVYSLFRHVATAPGTSQPVSWTVCRGIYAYQGVYLSSGNNDTDLGLIHTLNRAINTFPTAVTSIATGFNTILDVDSELYWIPKTIATATMESQPYFNKYYSATRNVGNGPVTHGVSETAMAYVAATDIVFGTSMLGEFYSDTSTAYTSRFMLLD
jgi:hypothetical protein